MVITDEFITTFLDLCRNGKTPTQIAVHFGILRDELLKLSKDDSFKNIWQQGKELYQAYHEDLLDLMMDPENARDFDTKVRDLQRWRLETLFKQDWSGKNEPELEQNKASLLSNDELEQRIQNLLNLSYIKQVIDSANS